MLIGFAALLQSDKKGCLLFLSGVILGSMQGTLSNISEFSAPWAFYICRTKGQRTAQLVTSPREPVPRASHTGHE
jgi:hypothetical protein